MNSMTETTRTLIFVGVAAVAGLAAWASQRETEPPKKDVPTGGAELFPDFKDALAAKSLEVVTFDDSTAELKEFRVALENGRWVITSHQNYPADAEKQMSDAAAGLIDIKGLAVASDVASDHALFGVVEPNVAKLKVYGREGEPCARCKGPIKKIFFAGRGTHFCPKCQK